MILWAGKFNAARHRFCVTGAQGLFIKIGDISDYLSLHIESLQSSKPDNVYSIKPDAPNYMRLSIVRLRKFLQQVVPSHDARVFLCLRTNIRLFLKKVTHRIDQVTFQVNWSDHEGVSQVLGPQVWKSADCLFLTFLLVLGVCFNVFGL